MGKKVPQKIQKLSLASLPFFCFSRPPFLILNANFTQKDRKICAGQTKISKLGKVTQIRDTIF